MNNGENRLKIVKNPVVVDTERRSVYAVEAERRKNMFAERSAWKEYWAIKKPELRVRERHYPKSFFISPKKDDQ